MYTSPDELCGNFSDSADKKSRLTIEQLDIEDEPQRKVTLIEGDSEALEFLGNLLLAQAKNAIDCGFQVGGENFFTHQMQGIYIHRVPCSDTERK